MKKILVIEDNDFIRETIITILTLEGFDVIKAPNGKIGVTKAIFENPDFIICDVNMPIMNGFEVLGYIRKNEKTSNIPFIFLTSRTEKDDVRKGMNLGADDYIFKPVQSEDLLNAVNSRLKKADNQNIIIRKQINKITQELKLTSAHELYTPLNGILGYSDLIKNFINNLSKDKILEMVENIEKAGRRLKHTIDNILLFQEINKYENNLNSNVPTKGKSVIDEYTVEQLFNNLASKYKRKKDLDINIETKTLAICGEVLKKVIDEIVDNALKFSKKDTKIIVNGEANTKNYALCIKDHGIGMSDDEINNISAFRQFKREKMEYQGSGLGLFIVKKIVEINGGSVILESVKDKYTKVIINLPIQNK